MVLFPELEKILRSDTIPVQMQDELNQSNGEIRILDISKSFDEIISQIAGTNMLLTNYVVLLENPKNGQWVALSTRKPHYLPGYSNCQIDIIRYNGQEKKIHGSFEEIGGRIACEPWNGDEKTPSFPLPKSLAMGLYEEAKIRVRTGHNLTFTSLENAKAGTSYTFPENAFLKIKLKDDPRFHQAVEELATYLNRIKNDFKGKDLHMITIEYTLQDWRYDSGSNPWKSVVREALRKISFVDTYKDIDPHGSGDGGTLIFEVAPLNGRKTVELYSIGIDAKPTGELDEQKFKSEVSSMELDAVMYFA